jgi:tetratricopeptide (TPR) repeat protein
MKGIFFTAVAVAVCCALVVLLFSCNKTPDAETLRLYVRAGETYAAGRFSETAEILGKEKKFPPSLLLRAKAEYFDGDFENAEKSCRAALRKRRSSYEAKLFMARILREKNDLAKTEKLLESLLADNPQDVRALRLAAEISIEERKFDEASAFLDRAAEFSAESAMVLLDRARLRWRAGRNREALEDLDRAKAMLPWDTPLLRAISNLEKTVKEAM